MRASFLEVLGLKGEWGEGKGRGREREGERMKEEGYTELIMQRFCDAVTQLVFYVCCDVKFLCMCTCMTVVMMHTCRFV